MERSSFVTKPAPFVSRVPCLIAIAIAIRTRLVCGGRNVHARLARAGRYSQHADRGRSTCDNYTVRKARSISRSCCWSFLSRLSRTVEVCLSLTAVFRDLCLLGKVGVLAELLRDPLPTRMRRQVSGEECRLPMVVDRTLPCSVDVISVGCLKVGDLIEDSCTGCWTIV